MEDVFELEAKTVIDLNDSYLKAYPHMLSYGQNKDSFTESDFVVLSHMVYGWMPTIITIDKSGQSVALKTGAALLTKAKIKGALTEQELEQLKSLVNNSIIGVSKLLHFVNPEKFPIWDSRIFQYCYRKKAHSSANNVKRYLKYIELLNELIEKNRNRTFLRALIINSAIRSVSLGY